MKINEKNFWPYCIESFSKDLTKQQLNTWIIPLEFKINGKKAQIVAPNQFVLQWVKEKFALRIETLLSENLKDISLKYIVDKKNKKDVKSSSHVASKLKDITIKKPNIKNTGLNTSFNFSNFVTGKANQLASAAAKQIAENPGEAYNPLFIFGGVGVGKTHLIHAIGNHLKNLQPEAKVKYLHAERYVHDVVKAYENKAFDGFKKSYHSLDLLLIDDIQFIGKKNRTQEEFFYAFNTLIENKKQIIITCDSYPKEIPGVDERLRTRFSWGLTVVIDPQSLK